MLKILILLSLATTAGFVASSRLTYSATQLQLLSGAGIKVMPDPSNIWSFHDTVTTSGGTADIPIFVDFDNNKRMDSELKGARVYVTDVQVIREALGVITSAVIHDDSGPRWDILAGGTFAHQFQTPLVVPVGSKLFVRVQTNPATLRVSVNMIGRLVTL